MAEPKKLRVYLDNCSFNRPFDDQMQLKVILETEAKQFIQRQILTGIFEPFDYTKWHSTLFDSLSVEEISHAAMQDYVVDDKKTLA
jgi:hypothetical protein